MEGLEVTEGFWKGRRVFLTGHSGFKGAWLSLWLQRLGARVTGYSLGRVSDPSLFDLASVEEPVGTIWGDVRDAAAVAAAMAECRPEVVFHLAAQALVRESYRDPVGTYSTNVMGTANVLEAVRSCPTVGSVVVVTSDKCYENKEWVWGYREADPVGGFDPYSSSKGCAELVAAAWRRSFFEATGGQGGPVLATARAGNVIGGGDWADDRLIPDCVRALTEGTELSIRYPGAVRPWQFVLEPLRGYLAVAERSLTGGSGFGQAWNFGPRAEDARPVSWLVQRFAELTGGRLSHTVEEGGHPHEAHFLGLDCSKARAGLDWRPALDAEAALSWTAAWYGAHLEGADMREVSLNQIADYEALCQS